MARIACCTDGAQHRLCYPNKIRTGNALDMAINNLQKLENRKRLADATSRYTEQLDSEALTEENALARDMTSRAGTIYFDEEK